MGTTYSVKIVDKLNEYQKRNLVDGIDSTLISINQIFSTYISDSEISNVNNNINFTVSDEFKYVFNKSKSYYKLSKSAFDITVHPLVQLWGFGNKESIQSPPDSTLVQETLNQVGLQKVKLQNNDIIKKSDVELDMSAIAKGYGVDKISEYLLNHSVYNFMIEIGGEVRCHGLKDHNTHWAIGIQNPIKGLQNKLYLENASIATSGSYNNFFKHNGRVYSHTINPVTGYPVDHALVSATIIAPNCIDADALATSVMVLGVKEGLELVESLDNIECYLIEAQSDSTLVEFKSSGFSKYEI
jgi:thiamine biosynthesis lipoprotein